MWSLERGLLGHERVEQTDWMVLRSQMHELSVSNIVPFHRYSKSVPALSYNAYWQGEGRSTRIRRRRIDRDIYRESCSLPPYRLFGHLGYILK